MSPLFNSNAMQCLENLAPSTHTLQKKIDTLTVLPRNKSKSQVYLLFIGIQHVCWPKFWGNENTIPFSFEHVLEDYRKSDTFRLSVSVSYLMCLRVRSLGFLYQLISQKVCPWYPSRDQVLIDYLGIKNHNSPVKSGHSSICGFEKLIVRVKRSWLVTKTCKPQHDYFHFQIWYLKEASRSLSQRTSDLEKTDGYEINSCLQYKSTHRVWRVNIFFNKSYFWTAFSQGKPRRPFGCI